MTGGAEARVALAAAALLAAGAAAMGCGESSGAEPAPRSDSVAERPSEPAPSAPSERDAKPPHVEPVACPADLAGCRSARGEIVYVERVDPDGDGDAHFVLFSDQSITAPGISVIDVARELRPHPLPGPGDALSAAGPVRTGSFGQRQIEAVAVRASAGND